MHTVEAIGKVLVIGLLLGAGLPALFAFGMRFFSAGEGGQNADGTYTAPNPAARAIGYLIFAITAAIIVLGLLWVTRQTLYFHFGWKIFPFGYK